MTVIQEGIGMDSLVSWLGGEAKTVAFAILSGVVGFLAKSVYDLWADRRKDRLARINEQLKLLYGPLYSLNQSSNLQRARPSLPVSPAACCMRWVCRN